MKNPIARSDDLVIQDLPEEILVYDMKTNEAHCLNKPAAFVWKYCDGKNSVADIAKLLRRDLQNAVDDDFVRLAINLLDEKDLLDEKNNFDLPNRRELLRKIGHASMIALPVVASLIAPPAALAGNCVCLVPANCITQTGCPSTVNCNGSAICAP